MNAADPGAGTRNPDCMMSLSVPASLEQEILDLLLATAGQVADISILHAEAPGEMAPLATAMEKVKGRARRSLVLAVTWQHLVPQLSGRVAGTFPGAAIRWWTTPLSAWGALDTESRP